MVSSEECHHGIPDPSSDASVGHLMEVVDNYLLALEEKETAHKRQYPYSDESFHMLIRICTNHLIDFLADENNQSLFGDELVNVCWSQSASILLDSDETNEEFESARDAARLGIHIDAWRHCGKSKFIKYMRERSSGRSPELDRYLHIPNKRTLTRRDLKVFLSERITCTCLDSAKALPRTLLCQNCGKEGEKGKAVMRCSRCRAAAYCSKECQVADWKSHKRKCSQMAEAKKQGFVK